jgi:hypothetical protein
MRAGQEWTTALCARDDVLEIEERDEETETHARAALRIELFDDADLVRERTGEDADAGALLDRRLRIDVGDRGRSAARTERRGKNGATGRHGTYGRGVAAAALGIGFAFALQGSRRRFAFDELHEAARVLLAFTA